MRPASDHQASFFDVDYLCEHLIPPESYYRKFRELVWPLLTDEDFAALYQREGSGINSINYAQSPA